MTENTENVKVTELEYIKRMEAVFCEIESLNQDIEQIKADAKKSGYNQTQLSKIAKLRAKCKIGDFVTHAKELVSKIEDNGL